MSSGAGRTGVCVVRAERDGPTELRITVTSRLDVDNPGCETVFRTVSVAVAVLHIQEFLIESARTE